MGIGKWFMKKTYPPAMVADNAVKQYKKAQYKDIGDSPKEIAETLWIIRYTHSSLDTKSLVRLENYFNTKFPIENMLDFCLSSLDIEFLISPIEIDTYEYAADYVCKELNLGNIPCGKQYIDNFIDKWNKLIKPLR